ncbi:MAG: trehalose-6-phosphate synthase [Chloroflexia bacterium]
MSETMHTNPVTVQAEVRNGLLSDHHLILASNRGPFEFLTTPSGVQRKRGAGGVVTAVSSVGKIASPTWVAAAMSTGDREEAARHGGRSIEVEEQDVVYRLRFVDLPEKVYDGYYNVIANPLLWFLQHYMWDTPREPKIGVGEWRAWHEGYVPANLEFASVIHDEIERSEKPSIVMIQDYHLYLVSGALRKLCPDVLIQFFLHIPFPGSDYLRVLPMEMRQEIVSSLLACDIIGFQTNRSAINFLRAAGSFISGVRVDYDLGVVEYKDHLTMVRRYPISIDPKGVRERAYSEQAERELAYLEPYFGERNILRVDRIEPSKNILRGFEAYSLMLDNHPGLHGKVKFLAILVPSRSSIPEYERYQDEVMTAIARINLRYGADYWRPVEALIGDNYVRALAAMRKYDVLLVNPLIDGMNLVAKEGVVVNERHGALVLSDGAGAFEQFAQSTPLPNYVSAADILGTSEALYNALQMPAPERAELSSRLREVVETEDVAHWFHTQLKDLQQLCEERDDDY